VSRVLPIAAITVRQIVSRRRTLVMLLLALAPAGLGLVARYFGAPYPGTPFLEIIPTVFTGFLVQIVCLFFGSSLVRDAIEERTAAFILTTPTSRRAYVVGVLLALVGCVLVILELAILATFVVWGVGLPGPFSGGAVFGPECLSLMGVVAIGVMVYSALFTLLGMLTRHCAVVGVVYYMIFEVFLAFVPGPARNLAISAHLDALLHERFVTRRLLSADLFDERAPYAIGAAVAGLVLALVFVGLVWGLVSRARRHDFVDLAEVAR
jgi:ABC-2 type transport system permease protein